MAIFFKYLCTLLSITLVIPALANPQGGGGYTQPGGGGGGGSTQPGGGGGGGGSDGSSQPGGGSGGSSLSNGPKATYYTTSDGLGTPSGSCGYGELGRTENNGQVCTATSRLYNNGAGCGACYQVRCKNKDLCSEEGTRVVVTDYGEGPGTDFILSYSAYAKLAKYLAVAAQLFAQGVVDIEYRRVSCKFGANLMIRIQEHSKFPSFLSIVVMNQGGATDILAVEIYEESSQKWISMRRAYGAVWDLSSPPCGRLKVRFLVSSSDGTTAWVQSDKAVIPAEWKAGVTVETDITLS